MLEGKGYIPRRKLERLSNIKELDVDDRSLEILQRLAEEQKGPEGKPYIFAPNHLEPENLGRRLSGVSDDFPVLNKVLRDAGFNKNYPVARGDLDIVINSLTEPLYKAHRKAWTRLGTSIADALPLGVNKYEPSVTQKANAGGIKRIISVLKNREGNITFYPYGNWVPPGAQDFSDEVSMPEGSFAEPAAAGEVGYETWFASVKRGAFALSRMTGSSVVPIYVDVQKGKWKIRVGEAIEAPVEVAGERAKTEIEADMANRYVHAMQQLKEAANENQDD